MSSHEQVTSKLVTLSSSGRGRKTSSPPSSIHHHSEWSCRKERLEQLVKYGWWCNITSSSPCQPLHLNAFEKGHITGYVFPGAEGCYHSCSLPEDKLIDLGKTLIIFINPLIIITFIFILICASHASEKKTRSLIVTVAIPGHLGHLQKKTDKHKLHTYILDALARSNNVPHGARSPKLKLCVTLQLLIASSNSIFHWKHDLKY